ncbi:hypothetical protein RJ640_022906 [Escallonia rubra]|uniref:Uncharacterized protein n=1 Tax=Escallonia rubra TaxID=112253 RepID=A0AA88UMQ8_9ASTE|nr:hypothetical protein RJ640_022906 [Escallonia rubra]
MVWSGNADVSSEENGYGTGQHAVKDRPTRKAVASGLQAEIGAQKRLEYGRRAVGALRPAAVHNPARASIVVTLAQQEPPKIVFYESTCRPGKAVERGAVASADELLPPGHVGGGAGVESGGVRHTDVEIVPRVPLNQQARDVPHPRQVNAAGPPVLVLGPPKIPCDPPHGDEVIPPV